MSTTRSEVYAVIDGERNYQSTKWGNSLSSGRPGDGARSLDEFILYISGYSDKAKAFASEFADSEKKLDIIRKVAALCVVAMEQHGAVPRK
jgi:hypothetical protein